jgi:hypothetical protein
VIQSPPSIADEVTIMSMRHIALAGTLLAIVFLAHAAGRFTQIGGAQIAASIAIYVLMALLLAPQMGWAPLIGIGFATGVLTMVATSSPFPPANIPAHGIGFLVAATLTRAFSPDGREISPARVIIILAITLLTSWTLFSTISWMGLLPTGHPLLSRDFATMGLAFGQGLAAWWTFGFVTIAIPTFVIGLILTPLLYRAVRPQLVRQGMLAA